jgi:protein SCO1/2
MTNRRPPSIVAVAIATFALAALPGCASSDRSGEGGSGAPASAATEAAAANPSSVTGYDGGLLPGNLRPRDFTLTNQDGHRVSLSDFRGKVTILTFLYTASKTIAPLIAQQIRGALDELESEHPGGEPVPALAISLDPAGDTPARVRAFLRAASLTGRMEYLTGTTAQLRPVWRAYSAPSSARAVAYERRAFVLLLDRQGAPRVEFPVEELTPEALAHDVRKLERE